MNRITLTIVWTIDSPFHIGTGLSESGGADRAIRINPKTGKPEFPGDAFKGTVRGMAERLARWLDDKPKPEPEDHSLPQYISLRRIFACRTGAANYRFSTPQFMAGGKLSSYASTAINPDTGVAKDNTLRITQSWTSGASFKAVITASNGDWSPNGADYFDLVLLYASLVAADSDGGRKSNGHGRLTIEKVEVNGIANSELLAPANLLTLQKRIRTEKEDTQNA